MMFRGLVVVSLALACRDAAPPPALNTPAEPQPPQSAPAAQTPQEVVVKATESFPPCVDDAFSLKLTGLSQGEVEKRYGTPASRESFRAEERQGEFYNPIESAYPSIEAKNRDVPLEEWTWKSGDCFLTVWFHRPSGDWRVLNDIYWHKDLDF